MNNTYAAPSLSLLWVLLRRSDYKRPPTEIRTPAAVWTVHYSEARATRVRKGGFWGPLGRIELDVYRTRSIKTGNNARWLRCILASLACLTFRRCLSVGAITCQFWWSTMRTALEKVGPERIQCITSIRSLSKDFGRGL